MEYIKPSAEVINIENEDIVTASCTDELTGSANCMKAGIIGEPNDPCNGGNGRLSVCGVDAQGTMCSKNKNNGVSCHKTVGTMRCQSDDLGIDGDTNCNRYAGMNSL